MATISRTLCVIGITVGSLLILGHASASYADNIPTSCDIESGAPSGFCASSTPGGIQAKVWREDRDQDSSQQDNNNSTVGDQRAQLTADAAASPEARTYAEDDQCDGRTMHRSSPVEWCNRFVSFGVGYALSWSGGSSCWVGWGVSRDLVRMSRLR